MGRFVLQLDIRFTFTIWCLRYLLFVFRNIVLVRFDDLVGFHTQYFAYSASSGNTGYFGLPVALMLFGDAVFAPYVMAMFGMTLFENTVGFFVVAKGADTFKDSALKVLKVPTLYAFIAGLLLMVNGMKWYTFMMF